MPIKQIRTNPVPSSAFTFEWYHGLPHDWAISSRLLLVHMILLIFPIFPHLSLVTTQAYVYESQYLIGLLKHVHWVV